MPVVGRLGGWPPSTDEAAAPKRPEEFELINDNCEIQRVSSTSSLWAIGYQDDSEPNCCEKSFEDSDLNIHDCTIATETDLFEIFVCNIVQKSIEWDDTHNELFMEEEKIDEEKSNVSNSIPAEEEETEMNPPMNFDNCEFILAFGEEESDRVDLNLAQRLAKKLANMVRIRKGLTVDSGAADHVMPIGWLIMFVVMASLGSKRGLHYVAADGTRIPNMGQQIVRFMTQDGTWCEWIFQVAGIHKPLVSVSKLIEAGYRVVFDEENSYIIHKRTKQIIKMRKERGVFVVDAYVTRASAGFTRPR